MAAVAGGALLALRLPWAVRLLGLLPLLLPALVAGATPAAGQFELLAVDVGQGQAVLVRTARHAAVRRRPALPPGQRRRPARAGACCVRALGERLDLLLLSHHGDSDHTGGAAAVLAQQPQAELLDRWRPGTAAGAAPGPALRGGQGWHWDGVRFELLHPPQHLLQPAPDAAGGVPQTHALSCVLRITAADGRAALLVGDITRPGQAPLAAAAPLAADLLLVPHHGSKTSSSDAFIAAVAPRLALVQAGYRNCFGHPPPRWRRATPSAASPWCRHRNAARRAGSRASRRTCIGERQAGRRYWHHPVP